jgi:putative membrane protein
MKRLAEYGVYAFKGMLVGAADVIPGVSGGTIAFITGIYEKLIGALNEIDWTAIKMLFTFRWVALYHKLNGGFLAALLFGVFTAVLSLARVVKFLLETYPEALWAFFFGLIIASVWVVTKHIRSGFTFFNILMVAIGTVVAWMLSNSQVVQTPHTSLYIYFAGIVSIVAMLMPGISGSYILVIIDKYRFIIDTISNIALSLKTIIAALLSGDTSAAAVAWEEMEMMPMLVFYAGTLTGIIGFSKVLNWLLKKHHDLTISLLTGFMVGSLAKIWPWKVTVATYTDSKGNLKPLLEENILPPAYDSYFYLSLLLVLVGFFLVFGLEKFASRNKETT